MDTERKNTGTCESQSNKMKNTTAIEHTEQQSLPQHVNQTGNQIATFYKNILL